MSLKSPSDDPEHDSGSEPSSRTDRPALRRSATDLARAAYRHLAGLWPLLALGAVGVAIVFTSDAPSIYAVAVALGTLGVAVGVRISQGVAI